MILSFEDYVIEEYQYKQSYNKVIQKIEKEEYKIPKNYKLFFQDRTNCPSCKIKTNITYSSFFNYSIDHYETFVRECPVCGWWQIEHDFLIEYQDVMDPNGLRFRREEKLFHAIIKKFSIGDNEIPLNTLFLELTKAKNILYDIHPTKMEEISQQVLKDFFNCEVHHVGKSGDGGKDLILISKDDKILVQVKRRTKSHAIESISTIRDILGTLFIENSKKGMVISTADHFSKESIKIKNQLIRERKLDYFELIDFTRFCEMLDITKKTKLKQWEKIIKVEGWVNRT
ncbi:MAG: restriction endonuclease [Ferruginibacter sp.]